MLPDIEVDGEVYETSLVASGQVYDTIKWTHKARRTELTLEVPKIIFDDVMETVLRSQLVFKLRHRHVTEVWAKTDAVYLDVDGEHVEFRVTYPTTSAMGVSVGLDLRSAPAPTKHLGGRSVKASRMLDTSPRAEARDYSDAELAELWRAASK